MPKAKGSENVAVQSWQLEQLQTFVRSNYAFHEMTSLLWRVQILRLENLLFVSQALSRGSRVHKGKIIDIAPR